MAAPSRPTVLSLRNISKSFGSRRVIDDVDLDVESGEVHALLGQNGSGKSTLIKILSGVYEPDPAGGGPFMSLRGEALALPLDPSEAVAAGIVAVHQDLALVGEATVLENLRIGRFATKPGWRIDWRRERQAAASALAAFGIDASPDRRTIDLDEVDRAMLAILRGLQGLPGDRPGILVLDEPTAHLPRDGVERVFAAIRRVAADGHGVMLVTHRLDEVMAITDRVSVIRDGRIRYVAATRDSTERALVNAILGFELGDLYPQREEARGDVALVANGLSGRRVSELSLTAHRGEILGVTGLVGAGQEEAPYLIFGGRQGGGSIAVGDAAIPQREMTPARAIEAGIALLPADRREASGIGALSVRENVSFPALRRFFRRGALDEGSERTHVQQLLGTFDVRPRDPELLLSSLSGGNQQKALLAKWFQTRPKVLLLHEPTHGIDIGSRRTIFKLIREAADAGSAIILFSAEYADLAHLCNRVIVMQHGRQVAELNGASLSEERIIATCMMNEPAT